MLSRATHQASHGGPQCSPYIRVSAAGRYLLIPYAHRRALAGSRRPHDISFAKQRRKRLQLTPARHEGNCRVPPIALKAEARQSVVFQDARRRGRAPGTERASPPAKRPPLRKWTVSCRLVQRAPSTPLLRAAASGWPKREACALRARAGPVGDKMHETKSLSTFGTRRHAWL